MMLRKNSVLSMNSLYLSEAAQNDLIEIKSYIAKELDNPNAADATVNKIIKSIHILENHAYAGVPLSSITDITTDYRFLVSGNYLTFYRVHQNQIYVDRILYSRRNYLRILLGDS